MNCTKSFPNSSKPMSNQTPQDLAKDFTDFLAGVKTAQAHKSCWIPTVVEFLLAAGFRTSSDGPSIYWLNHPAGLDLRLWVQIMPCGLVLAGDQSTFNKASGHKQWDTAQWGEDPTDYIASYLKHLIRRVTA